jgi:hypothetical protein
MTEKMQEKSTPLPEMNIGLGTSHAPLAAAPRQAMTAESEIRPTAQPDERPASRGGFWFVFWGNSFAALWTSGVAAFLWAILGVQSIEALAQLPIAQLSGLAFIAVCPALFFVMTGLLAREIVRHSNGTSRVEQAIRHLSTPAANAGQEIRTLSDAVTGEVERINTALESALARLAAMEEVISHHAEALDQSAGDARDRTEHMLKDLRKERLRLGEVSESLDDKAALIAAAISDQSKMVAAAAELAASQANENERRLRTSVDSLTDAGAAISDRSDQVAESIDQRASNLRELSNSLKERSENLDAAYVKHRERLSQAGEALRQEQEKIASALDFHRAELETMVSTARGGADALNDATRTGAAAFTKSVDSAITRARDLAETVQTETDSAAREHETALSRLVAAAQEAKSISDASIEAIQAQAEIISDKVEHTNEAAFAAARRSDEAFDSRMAEAEKLTARASQAADDASEAVRRRLDAVLASARAETQTVERQIETMTERLGEMPIMAKDRAQEAADAVRRGLEGLNSAALAAAEEAQEIDAAFQARIRQNYELLSEFMLHMGSVAGGRRTPDFGSNELPSPLPRRNRAEPVETSANDPDPAASSESDESDMHQGLSGESARTNPRAESAVGFPERGSRASDPGWRWKDLLSAMPASDDDDVARSNSRRREQEDER